MVGGQESARSLVHLAELFRLADKARVLGDPELAAARMRGCSRCRGSPDGRRSRGCRSTSRRCGRSGTCGRRSRLPAARDHGDRAVARPGGGDRPRRARGSACATAASAVTGLCRGGFFTAATAGGRAAGDRRQPAGGGRGGGARRRLPGAGGRPRCRIGKDIVAAREMVRDGIAAMLPHARAAACRWRSSRCTRCTPPTGPA